MGAVAWSVGLGSTLHQSQTKDKTECGKRHDFKNLTGIEMVNTARTKTRIETNADKNGNFNSFQTNLEALRQISQAQKVTVPIKLNVSIITCGKGNKKPQPQVTTESA